MYSVLTEAIAAFLAAAVITEIVRRFFSQRGFLDVPNARSSHSTPVPRGGGLSIVAVLLTAAAVLAWRGVVSRGVAEALLGGGLLIGAVGLVDDLYSLRASIRAGIHFLGATWAVWCLGGIGPLDLGWIKWDWGWIGQIVGVVGLVWMINLYNFMDGIDGIAGMEAVSAGGFGALLLVAHGHSGLAELALILVFACAGFLTRNWSPARIFMGDTGSGFLGFVLGVFVIASAKQQPEFVWPWLTLLAVFIVDATVTLLRRARRGERWYASHRSHAYQHATRACGSHAKVALSVGVINFLWLFPLAFAAIQWPVVAVPVTIIAILPLIWLARYWQAGEPEAIRPRPATDIVHESLAGAGK